jgi:hypothetical protein
MKLLLSSLIGLEFEIFMEEGLMGKVIEEELEQLPRDIEDGINRGFDTKLKNQNEPRWIEGSRKRRSANSAPDERSFL